MFFEIEYVEEEDEEDFFWSECYCLVVGFVLGFINLGKGFDFKGLYDMRVIEKFVVYVIVIKNVDIVYVFD